MMSEPKKSDKTEQQWREQLSEHDFNILREKGTDRAFMGEYTDCKLAGDYLCKGCGQVLFHSTGKFDSGCGWPSFFEAAKEGAVDEHTDSTHGMQRVEIVCSQCDGHLGHVFPDGPKPTGLRYCVNSASISLEPETSLKPSDE